MMMPFVKYEDIHEHVIVNESKFKVNKIFSYCVEEWVILNNKYTKKTFRHLCWIYALSKL